jgi:NAD(P)-dependent dehydrogenase (short-subunit alcohol dehydrogenase family)
MASVLITGTSAGIGLQTALVLGRAGHRVVATIWNLDRGASSGIRSAPTPRASLDGVRR